MRQRTVVILGGAQAGPAAAARARETDERARIVLVERGRTVGYAVGGLTYHLSGEVPRVADLDREAAEFFRDIYRVEVRTGASVEAIDGGRRQVKVNGEVLGYTALVHALGAESILPPIPGLTNAANVFNLRTLGDLEGIIAALAAARHVVVLGGGFFGVEAADGLLRRGGVDVTVVERALRLLPMLGETLSHLAGDALVRAGARVVTGDAVVEAERRGERVTALRTAAGERLSADLVVVAAGVRPRTALLHRAGARLRADGSVIVDRRAETSLPGVYACGVCVALPHAVTGRPVWFAQAAQADKSAQVAGANAAGGDVRLAPAVGTAIVRVGGLTLGRTGLGRSEAVAWAGADVATATVHAPMCDAFMPKSENLTVEVYFLRRTGRIIGAELAGPGGVDKRLDVLATAIRGRLSIDDLMQLDLGYAPPYSAARDAVNVAGAVAVALRAGHAVAWSPSDLARRRQSLVLVDVRTPGERAAGTIPSAVPLTLAELRDALARLPRRRLVFFCDTGRRGYLAARIARQHGRRDAGFLAGGLASWQAAGLATGGAAR